MATEPEKKEVSKTHTNREVPDVVLELCDATISKALGPIADIYGLDVVMLSLKNLVEEFPYDNS